MEKQKLTVSILTLSFAFLVTSCADSPLTHPAADDIATADEVAGPQNAIGLDAEFSRMAREFEGFGGMYVDEAGRLNVFVKGPPIPEMAVRGQLARTLGPSLGAHASAALMSGEIVVREGQYDYLQLATWHENMRPVLGMDGVVFTHVDESQNRLGIGVEGHADRSAVEAKLADLDIPLEAVAMLESGPITPQPGTLRDVQRPRGGGTQIVWERPGVGWFICTLGFNIMREEAGRSEPYFMTNSHCSAVRSEVTGTEYYQALPEVFGGHAREFIGTEVEDPPFFTAPCFPGFVCRWSDAAIAKYDRLNPVNFGAIYRTKFFGTGSSPGSLEVEDEDSKFFRIRGEIPFPQLNDVVNRIGRTSGWTQGPVVITCGNFEVAGAVPRTAMLCQDVVAAASAPGDSGSPVFTWSGSSKDVLLNGIHWGGGSIGGVQVFVFSAMDNIRTELEPFTTH